MSAPMCVPGARWIAMQAHGHRMIGGIEIRALPVIDGEQMVAFRDLTLSDDFGPGLVVGVRIDVLTEREFLRRHAPMSAASSAQYEINLRDIGQSRVIPESILPG